MNKRYVVRLDGEERRRLEETERRTRIDWARQIQRLIDVDYKKAEKITLVMDNLNTHGPASLYEAFEPAEARRLMEKLEIVYTPKHGSWLNVAEVELAVLGKKRIGGGGPPPGMPPPRGRGRGRAPKG